MKIGGVLGRVWWYTDCTNRVLMSLNRGAVRVAFWNEDGRNLARHGLTHGRVFARVFQLRVISTHGRGNLSVS